MFLHTQNLLIFYSKYHFLLIKVNLQIHDKLLKDYDFYYKECNYQMGLLIYKKKFLNLIPVKVF